MKKCPTCDKSFEDSYRFCQLDGTPLVDDAPPVDMYATMVAGTPPPISSQILEPAVPVADAPVEEPLVPAISAPEDVLQPENVDPLRTMYVSEAEMKEALASSIPVAEPVSNDPPFAAAPTPEPPKFAEPELPAPSFGDVSPPPSPFSSYSNEPESEPDTKASEPETSSEASFHQTSPPIPSPFDSPKAPVFESPAATPQFNEPAPPPFEVPKPAPSPFDVPKPAPSTFDVPQPAAFEPRPFEPPPVSSPPPFTPEVEKPSAPAAWTPPPAPDAGWQNQEIGSNTPFQPPPAGVGGQNKTLAIISLVLGCFGLISVIPTLLIVFCGILPLGLGIGASVTGFLARGRIKKAPDEYAGSGLAMGGIITGILSILAPLALVAITLILWLVWGTAVMTMPR